MPRQVTYRKRSTIDAESCSSNLFLPQEDEDRLGPRAWRRSSGPHCGSRISQEASLEQVRIAVATA